MGLSLPAASWAPFLISAFIDVKYNNIWSKLSLKLIITPCACFIKIIFLRAEKDQLEVALRVYREKSKSKNMIKDIIGQHSNYYWFKF
jgi:hypothetical protein